MLARDRLHPDQGRTAAQRVSLLGDGKNQEAATPDGEFTSNANAGGSIHVHIAGCVNPSALVPLALTISSKSVSVVIFVDETVHSMPQPLSYNKSEMSHEN